MWIISWWRKSPKTSCRHRQQYNRAFTGEVKFPPRNPPLPLDDKRSCAAGPPWSSSTEPRELRHRNPHIPRQRPGEEKCDDMLVMISESGSIGGVPGAGKDFGCHWNIEASCDQETTSTSSTEASGRSIFDSARRSERQREHIAPQRQDHGSGRIHERFQPGAQALFIGNFTAADSSAASKTARPSSSRRENSPNSSKSFPS